MGCPNCQWFYDNYEGGKPVIHLAELLAMAAGDTETLKFHRIPLNL
jgi:heterodisulfide reductase subunit B